MPTFEVKHSVTDQFIGDVLTTALEGGIGYWSTCVEINRAHPTGGRVADQVLSALTVIDAKIVDCEWFNFTQTASTLEVQEDIAAGGGPAFPESDINHQTVIDGITAILSGKVRIRSDLMDQVVKGVASDDADIDADAADCIVQAGLFGEVVYG